MGGLDGCGEGGVGVKRGEDEGALKATGTSSPSSPFVGFDEGAVATLSPWGRGAAGEGRGFPG